MWQKIKLIFTDPDLRKKIFFILGILAVFRVGAAIPIPGVDHGRLEAFFSGNQFFGLLNIFSGGAMENLSIMMLGVGPYITASIIMQLLTMIFPRLKEMYQEEGEAGRQKVNQYSRLATVPLAALQGFALMSLLKGQGVLGDLSFFDQVTNIIIITAGSILLMWLGELMSEYGIGNGVSILIFAGIIAGVPQSLGQTIFASDIYQLPIILGFAVAAVLVVSAVVVITEGQRPVPISYARRIRGSRMYGGVSTYLPLKVNQAGVIPIIFALSILLFPQMIVNFLAGANNPVVQTLAAAVLNFLNSPWVYAALYFILVFLFTYFYTAVTFDPDAISSNLQKSGAFVPGIRPGKPTSEFLYKILNRITLIGALFLGVIAVLPLAMRAITGLVTLTIGGTALLIVVSVVLETIKQVEAQIVMRSYE
ncbi:MAG: preprotein translocase subunit SecY [Candidatus Niyogibacteria bacterium RIFCSPLOWO2_01_FULL_45_48]|uniref:Protein translocase subunit SecY n=2 Tax=Candidatus Niyogiibacteriota TaxID=1817912 RepID=A0A1G2EZI1_9BACT|nr:MAG: preprotein translocase subunit SecY [Candidatus Niyogibacteria bacterium RIFCSPHIGHO2_01_FULL_45_28]OGZ30730.1 MAG: preprotein translocase subunit SecY [Candidatus Niyogibacteria bacterium RIFCSPLOWO2_01_FULL_45_48]OGZ31185.1 MAG: preprotein translocase subunit SecY [Candidatus Niyogibacteria bacterium RIFCSPLOWO2_02_FULL_45_13]